MDGSIFNLSYLRSKSKVTRTAITELQYADDCAILSHTEEALQATLNLFFSAYHNLRLSLNIGKTKVLFQPAPGVSSPSSSLQITINGEFLETVQYFLYLGSHLSQSVNLDVEIQYNGVLVHLSEDCSAECLLTEPCRMRLRSWCTML